MRIMFINPGGHAQGGAERSLATLISGLVERGHEATVLTMQPGDAATAFRDAGAAISGVLEHQPNWASRHQGGGRFMAKALLTTPDVAKMTWAMRRAIHRSSPDIVHSNGFRSNVLAPFLSVAGVPVVVSVRDSTPNAGQRALLRAAAKYADAIIANSAFTAGQFDHRDVHVVHNPIETPEPPARERARAVLAVSPDRPVVAMLAHLHRSKGHDVMIDALALWPEQERPLLLVAGGDLYAESASYRSEVVARAAALGVADQVRFLGPVDDVSQVLGAADVVVHPCRHPEGFGRTVAEAQAAGVPVVATGLGGVLEIIRHDETGLLVEPDDPGALQAAIDRVLWPGPTRSRLVSMGLTSSTRFRPETHAQAVESVYRTVLGLPLPADDSPSGLGHHADEARQEVAFGV